MEGSESGMTYDVFAAPFTEGVITGLTCASAFWLAVGLQDSSKDKNISPGKCVLKMYLDSLKVGYNI